MHSRHVLLQNLGSSFWHIDDFAECGVYGRFVEALLHFFGRLMQLAGALHQAREDVDEVEAGFALFGEIDGGLVGDDLRVCESFGFVDGFCGFGWKACFDVVCYCSSATLESWLVTKLTSCAKLDVARFEYEDA